MNKLRLTEDQVARIARALAEPRRVRILEQLGASQGATQCQAVLDKQQPVTMATLSHHMKELEAAGLIRMERKGKFKLLSLQREILGAYLERLSDI